MLPDPLLHKYECPDSLTIDPTTDYRSERRAGDRVAAWSRIDSFRAGRDTASLCEPVDCTRFDIAEICAPHRTSLATDIPRSSGTHPSLAASGLLQPHAPDRREPVNA